MEAQQTFSDGRYLQKNEAAAGQYNQPGITLAPGQICTLQLDVNGNLKVVFPITDPNGNIVSISEFPVGGLNSVVTYDPKAIGYLELIWMELKEANKLTRINLETNPSLKIPVPYTDQ